MRTIACIPARYHSVRFPGKPLALIRGKPLIQHVYERALCCPDLTEVYVATDHERISQCVNGFGGRAVMTRSDHKSGTDRICEAAQKIGLEEDDLVVNIQGDQPLFSPPVVSRLVEPFKNDPAILMTTLKYKARGRKDFHNSNCVKVVTDNEGFALYFSRSPIPFFRDSGSGDAYYYKHLGFYGYRLAFLVQFTTLAEGVLESIERLEQLRALEHGFKIKVEESPCNSIDIDVPEDIKKAEELLRELREGKHCGD